MNFTSGEWLALITAVSALVVVVGGVVVNVIVSLRTSGQVTTAVVQLEEVKEKAEAIKTHVDGASSRADARIESLLREIMLIRDVNADQKQTAAVLAQAKTTIVSKELNGPVVDESLQNIDQNTKAIEKNTANTEATVKKLEQDK